jgi:hypothetical protein
MRTSGGGNRDLMMLGIPLAMLVMYGLLTGGGFGNVLRVLERTLWTAVDSFSAFFS